MLKYSVSKDQLYLFNNGLDYESFNIFGSHLYNHEGVDGVRFLVYAPHAKAVSVVGDFNDWDKNRNYMEKDEETGTFISFIPGLKQYDSYKYAIETQDGKIIFKSDPYAVHSEVRPHTASKVYDMEGYEWHDQEYMNKRNESNHFLKPKNIYEVHFGSFLLKEATEKTTNQLDISPARFLNYQEIADVMIPYVKKMGYTHIEVMPIMEYPFDGSWGYQTTGYFSITSRFGVPKDFMAFVDRCHQENIGVIIDWVPGHYCKDEHGLYKFDGDFLYDGKEHKHWGTMTFNFAKKEVRSFLNSSACFFIEKYHVDGIRVDGVSSMLYLNYGVDNPADRVFNKYGEEGDLEAIEYLQQFNKVIGEHFPGVMTIAEESTAWPNVTKPSEIGGLGFHYKWDMGWMNDTLNYMKTDFPYREKDHDRLTFSMMYADAENYILPLSHDEVVYGKCSLINKMPGGYDDKFKGLKNLILYQVTRPGGKLNFMGNEIAQFDEWKYFDSIEWNLLDVEKHKKHQDFIIELNKIYLNEKSLWEQDFNVWDGFQWIDANNRKQNIYIYERKAKEEADRTIIILNFGRESFEQFRLGSSLRGIYKEILNSNDTKWGGDGNQINTHEIPTEEIAFHGKECSVEIKIPALSSIILKLIEKKDPPKKPKIEVENHEPTSVGGRTSLDGCSTIRPDDEGDGTVDSFWFTRPKA